MKTPTTPKVNLNTASVTPKAAEPKVQEYKFSRPCSKLITESGKIITFINYTFLTLDQECIDYLDQQIAGGMTELAKGSLMTATEADPMSALKRKHIQEYLDAQSAQSANPGEDFGSYGAQSAANKLNPSSTQDVAGMAGESSSPAAK